MKSEETFEALESKRLELQSRLDALQELPVRNEMGQFATPPALAMEIVRYVRRIWRRRSDRVRFLDPAVGTGAFYSALIRGFEASFVESATGIEIDARLAGVAEQLWGNSGLMVIHGDFTRLSVSESDRRYNLVLTNPPYVRHHHISQSEKSRLMPLAKEVVGRTVNGLAGLYCYFMLLAHRWLAKNGIGVWLVPSEFMDVNYGSMLKEYLTDKVTLLHIHRFDAKDLQFDEALVSSAVVVFKNKKAAQSHKALFSYGGLLTKPRTEMFLPVSRLRSERKWSALAFSRAQRNSATSGNDSPLGSLFTIKRGIATGGNNFFILPRAEAQRMEINERFYRPILPSPRYLEETIVKSDAEGYPLIEKQLVLIDTDLPEREIADACPSLYKYLQLGKKRGMHLTYLSQRRVPWYKQERRDAAPFLCTYMGRPSKGRSPFRFILNFSRAVATNVYLLLYPVGPLREMLVANPSMTETVYRLLQQIEPENLVGEGRVYGGGLHKIEPAELARVSASHFLKSLNLKRRPRCIQRTLSFRGIRVP